MDFLKICRAELDRLIEQSPPIPDPIIDAFEKEFFDMPRLKKPDIAHGIDHTKIFRDTNSNIKKLIVDATVMLKQKKKVWHQAMMPDVDKHFDKRMEKEIADLSKSFNKSLEEKLKLLEEKIATTEKTSPRLAFKTSIRGSAGIRLSNLSVNTTLPGSAVSPADLIDALSQKPETQEQVTVVIDQDEQNEYAKKS
jgi:hypothetical protein